MNHAIIIAGGVGTRMGLGIPKQYIEVAGKPIFLYSFEKFAQHDEIHSIVLVIAPEWQEFVRNCVQKTGYKKRVLYVDAGKTRQHSVYNGLLALQEIASREDLVLIHDSVRPLFPISNIDDGIDACRIYDAALPVISVKDATYQSTDGTVMSAILPREQLYSGQSPETFRFQKYLDAHKLFSDAEIAGIRGSSELAFRAGLTVSLIHGKESNFKLTTIEDLRAFETTLNQ